MPRSDNAEEDQPVSEGDTVGAIPAEFDVIKTYPPRGALQQYRLAGTKQFSCCQCHKSKTSKLIVIKEGKWDPIWCNGYYGTNLAYEKTSSSSKSS